MSQTQKDVSVLSSTKSLSVSDDKQAKGSTSNTQFKGNRRNLTVTAIKLLIGLFFVALQYHGYARSKEDTAMANSSRLSNGTHEYERTVILVSIDGMRAEYLERGFTPHLLRIGETGLRAKSMKPVFPTSTFPNHWTLLTGLYPESHGIVANNFWDPEMQEEFYFTDSTINVNPLWWKGEPIWETAEKAGIKTANLMWAGPPTMLSGISPTYFVPYRDHVSLSEKRDQVMDWIDLPLEERPRLLLVYDDSIDHAGHSYGPMSINVNETLPKMDNFARNLLDSLEHRNLSGIVDVIFVSDHGMTDTSNLDPIYVDEILGDGYQDIVERSGDPSMGLRFKPGANVTKYTELLQNAAAANPGKFNTYTLDTMPKEYHFTDNNRIAPLWAVPNITYILTDRKTGHSGMPNGQHGYDNDEPAMQAIFFAHGPFATGVVKTTRITGLPALWRIIRDLWFPPPLQHYSEFPNQHLPDDFRNLEVYNLITKILAIDRHAAPNNGTAGFWDVYS